MTVSPACPWSYFNLLLGHGQGAELSLKAMHVSLAGNSILKKNFKKRAKLSPRCIPASGEQDTVRRYPWKKLNGALKGMVHLHVLGLSISEHFGMNCSLVRLLQRTLCAHTGEGHLSTQRGLTCAAPGCGHECAVDTI